jgi:outer membrane protein OmpA-like peptidoglycan-associated protein
MMGARNVVATCLALLSLAGCALIRQERQPYTTERDKTRKGAGIGAAAGAAAAVLAGEREADEILAGAAIGAVVGIGVGAYRDRQEEKLARIPGTRVERVSPGVLLVHFDATVLFDTDSSVIRAAGRGTLDQVAGVLEDYDKTAVVVQGHTDSMGSETHNQALSQRRADAARAHLAARGVDANRLTALGYGEGYPVADNATPVGRQRNRRVDVLLKAKVR